MNTIKINAKVKSDHYDLYKGFKSGYFDDNLHMLKTGLREVIIWEYLETTTDW